MTVHVAIYNTRNELASLAHSFYTSISSLLIILISSINLGCIDDVAFKVV